MTAEMNSEEAMNWLIDIMEAEGYVTGVEAPASVPENTASYYAIGACAATSSSRSFLPSLPRTFISSASSSFAYERQPCSAACSL